MDVSQLAGVLTPVLAQFALELETVEVVPAGKRSLLRVVVDGDGPTGSGPLLDDVAEASKAVSAALDASDATGAGAYTLEVSTRGVSRPLERAAHWRRNRGRLVAVALTDQAELTGRILEADEEAAVLEVEGARRTVPLAEVTRAQVQVELNRPKEHAGVDAAPAGEED